MPIVVRPSARKPQFRHLERQPQVRRFLERQPQVRSEPKLRRNRERQPQLRRFFLREAATLAANSGDGAAVASGDGAAVAAKASSSSGSSSGTSSGDEKAREEPPATLKPREGTADSPGAIAYDPEKVVELRTRFHEMRSEVLTPGADAVARAGLEEGVAAAPPAPCVEKKGESALQGARGRGS